VDPNPPVIFSTVVVDNYVGGPVGLIYNLLNINYLLKFSCFCRARQIIGDVLQHALFATRSLFPR